MTLPIFYGLFLYSISGLIFFLIAFRIRQSYLKTGKTDIFLKSFMMIFFLWGIFELSRGFPYIYVMIGREELFSQLMRWGYVIGNLLLILTAIYGFMLSASLYWPKKQNFGIGAILFLGVINIITLMMTPFSPEYRVKEGITLMNLPSISQPPITLVILIGWGILAIIFLLEAIKGRVKGVLRTRAWLIGGGILITIISGPLHGILKTAEGTLFVDTMNLIGKLLAAVGVLVFKPKEETRPFYEEVGSGV
jgi:hypothetical protein